MKSIRAIASVFIAGAIGFGGAAFAADANDLGKREYNSNCHVCHGFKGEGDGPLAIELKKTTPNLSTLSKRNNGVFPFALVYEIIDGTQNIGAHGTREMPIWGPRYKIEAGESFYDDFRADHEVFVRARILALTEYIYRLQAK